jgi:hypothetical protein
MAMPVESGSATARRKFHAMPQPALPPKDYRGAASCIGGGRGASQRGTPAVK